MTALEPAYGRAGRSVGVIHFGLGAFHRGHQAVYFDEAMRNQLGEWGIYGVSPRSSQVSGSLRKQNFCYTVNARSGKEQNPTVVASIFDGGLFERSNPELQRAVLSPELKLITVTVTEKAYVAGVESESMPNRILDLLTTRYRAGLAAPTVISCDNLPNNGEFLRNVLLDSANARSFDNDLMRWIEEIQLPNSMVDRIVPAITEEAINQFEKDFGYRDESLISTEPFRQWVVEPHPAPYDLTTLGIEVTSDVESFEQLKLRLFNGAHSATAYFSQLAGYEFVYQAMAIPEWNSYIEKLQEQLAKSFSAPSSMDVVEYSQTARARIGNSALAHRSAQIAMDGSAKLPQRLFRALNTLGEKGRPRECVSFAVALWIRFLQSGLAVADPLLDQLLARTSGESALDVLSSIMRCPGLRSPVSESEWQNIATFVDELRVHSPIEIARTL